MNKKERYALIRQQLADIWSEDLSTHTHLSNLCAILKKEFDWFWVGFYTKSEAGLSLGPYQGELPCFHIKIGSGACGKAAEELSTQILDDVEAYPGYIACHPEPKSEIVVPGVVGQECLFVLDVDSERLADFDQMDKQQLELIALDVTQRFFR